jgi:hypothetical protein
MLFRKVMLTGDKIGTVHIRYDLSQMRERRRQYGAMMLVVGLGSLLVAFLLPFLFQRSISEPIRKLAQVTVGLGRWTIARARHRAALFSPLTCTGRMTIPMSRQGSDSVVVC